MQSTAWYERVDAIDQKFSENGLGASDGAKSPMDGMVARKVAQLCLGTDTVLQVGKGSFGAVFAHGALAVKIPVDAQGNFKASSESVREEKAIKELKNRKANFRNLVSMELVAALPGVIFMPCAVMSLYEYTMNNNKATESFLDQLMNGLEAIESINSTHGDFKPQNVMLYMSRGSWILKIGDFGTLQKSSDMGPHATTYAYTSPATFIKYILGEWGEAHREPDTWSLLCVLLELGTTCKTQAVKVPSNLNSIPNCGLFTLCIIRKMTLNCDWDRLLDDMALGETERKTVNSKLEMGFEWFSSYNLFWEKPSFFSQIGNLLDKNTSRCEDVQTMRSYFDVAHKILSCAGRISVTQLLQDWQKIKELDSNSGGNKQVCNVGSKRKSHDLY